MPQSSTRAAYLVIPAHAADWCRGRRVCSKCLRSAGGVSPARTEIIPARLKRTKGRIRRGTLFLGGNLQTKLTRRSAGAVHLWLGYAGRSSGLGQPHQPATVSVGCEEVPEHISGRRRCVWGSWHLQTVHASDHCDLWRRTGYHTALSKHSCSTRACPCALPEI